MKLTFKELTIKLTQQEIVELTEFLPQFKAIMDNAPPLTSIGIPLKTKQAIGPFTCPNCGGFIGKDHDCPNDAKIRRGRS